MPNENNDMPDLIDKLFVNLQSGKIYKCTELNRPELRLYLERVGDRKAVAINVLEFYHKYRSLTEEEEGLIETHRDKINNLTEALTLNLLQRLASGQGTGADIGIVETPTERDSFTNLILRDDVKKSIDIGLAKLQLKDFLNNDWNLKSIESMDGRCIMNFWGPPGVGKTASAKAIAHQLGKKLYKVNYSQVISKWVGDTGKHLTEVFKNAKEGNHILFFDEADSMLSRRIGLDSGDAAYSSSINQNRNILMQELDKFNGIVILATNLFGNYDEAILRRVAHHVEFKLPTEEMRQRIFELHIPKEVTKDEDVDIVACAHSTKDFSGGDIKNVCINAMIAGAMEEPRMLRQQHLIEEIDKISESKRKHKFGSIKKKPIGINAKLLTSEE